MDSFNIRIVIIALLGVAVIALSAVVILLRRKRGSSRRSKYIEALYALIEGRREAAYTLLAEAVKNGEDDVDAYIQLGNLMRERNQAEKAFQLHKGLTVRQGLTLDEEKSIQLSIADDLAAMGKMGRATAALEAVGRKRRDQDVLKALHRLYHIQGDYEQAYGTLREMSRIDRNMTGEKRADYLTSVACGLIDTGKKDEARKLLDRALREEKNHAGALYLSARLAMERGDLNSAVRTWERLLALDMGYFREVASRLEKALFETGRFSELEGILLRLLEAYPADSLLLAALARFYSKKGELSRGIDLLENEKTRIPSDKGLAICLAELYLKDGREDEALAILEESDRVPSSNGSWKCGNCGEEYGTGLGFCRVCCRFDSIQRYDTD